MRPCSCLPAGRSLRCQKEVGCKDKKTFCQIAVGKLGYSGAEVAGFLGVTTSCVNRLAASREVPEISGYL